MKQRYRVLVRVEKLVRGGRVARRGLTAYELGRGGDRDIPRLPHRGLTIGTAGLWGRVGLWHVLRNRRRIRVSPSGRIRKRSIPWRMVGARGS